MDPSTLLAAKFASYDTVIGMTLFGYDYLLMLPKEIRYVWYSPWTPGKVLYFAVRYMPFVDMPVWPFADAFMGGNLPMPCSRASDFTLITFLIAACLADILYGLRTWALWSRNKYFGIFLVVSGVVFNLACILMLALVQSGDGSIRIPELPGCFSPQSSNDHTVWKAYLLTTSFQLLLFLSTLVKGIHH
ncbi:hypothetical protein DACRYDRAFT_72839, partial [Dacryopinax primogenitus]